MYCFEHRRVASATFGTWRKDVNLSPNKQRNKRKNKDTLKWHWLTFAVRQCISKGWFTLVIGRDILELNQLHHVILAHIFWSPLKRNLFFYRTMQAAPGNAIKEHMKCIYDSVPVRPPRDNCGGGRLPPPYHTSLPRPPPPYVHTTIHTYVQTYIQIRTGEQ